MTAKTSQPVYGAGFGGSATENYQRYFVPVIGGPFAADLVAAAQLRKGERVLDVACGTGVVARLAAERVGEGGSVAGLDINPGMLQVARSIAPSGGTTIRWYETSAESMPLPDESFDVALCQLGLQFIADKEAALREMRRVLAPGGRVLVSVPTPTPLFDGLAMTLARHVPAAAGFVRTVFSLNDPVQVASLLRGAGFADVATRVETKRLDLPSSRDFFWQYIRSTPMTDLIPEGDDRVTSALERDIVATWQPWVANGGMRCEQGMIVATAVRASLRRDASASGA